MKAAIFLKEVLTFVFVYNVELIVLWAVFKLPPFVSCLFHVSLFISQDSV